MSSSHPTSFVGSIPDAIREAITQTLPEATVTVDGGGGHFTIEVVAPAFEGKSMLQSHRLVMASIAHLMAGDAAPVHAVDSLKTRAR